MKASSPTSSFVHVIDAECVPVSSTVAPDPSWAGAAPAASEPTTTMTMTSSAAIDKVPAAKQEMYPNADAEGLVVLGVLDDALEDAQTPLVPQKVDPRDIAPPVSCGAVAIQFRWPLWAVSIVGIVAICVIYVITPPTQVFYYQIFPYFACTVNFLGGVPSTKASLDSIAEAIIPRLATLEESIRQSTLVTQSKASEGYQQSAEYLKCKVGGVVSWLRGEGGGGGEGADSLPSAPPKSSVVDESTFQKLAALPANLEKDMTDTDNVVDDVRQDNGSDGRQQEQQTPNLRGSKHAPIWLHSKEHFTFLVTIPILVLMFLVQLLVVWYFRILAGLFTEPGDDITARSKYSPLILTAQTFLAVCLQIQIALWMARASRVARIINVRMQARAGDVNGFKQRVASAVAVIRKQILTLCTYLAKLWQASNWGSRITDTFLGRNRNVNVMIKSSTAGGGTAAGDAEKATAGSGTATGDAEKAAAVGEGSGKEDKKDNNTHGNNDDDEGMFSSLTSWLPRLH